MGCDYRIIGTSKYSYHTYLLCINSCVYTFDNRINFRSDYPPSPPHCDSPLIRDRQFAFRIEWQLIWCALPRSNTGLMGVRPLTIPIDCQDYADAVIFLCKHMYVSWRRHAYEFGRKQRIIYMFKTITEAFARSRQFSQKYNRCVNQFSKIFSNIIQIYFKTNRWSRLKRIWEIIKLM